MTGEVEEKTETPPGERIAKRMARAGVCSRREAEKMISDGRVAVDGKVIDSPALNVGEEAVIRVDGKIVALPEKTRLWRYHKPVGLICTHTDPKGRPTVFENLPRGIPRVVSVGRLDINSEGLLLLTNDGELARRLELPANAWTRRYRVRVWGTVGDDAIKRLAAGLTVEGVKYAPIRAAVDRVQGSNTWLTVALAEGKNREVRKTLASLGLQVNRLIRTSFGPFQLGALKVGEADEVPEKALKEQLGDAGKSTGGKTGKKAGETGRKTLKVAKPRANRRR